MKKNVFRQLLIVISLVLFTALPGFAQSSDDEVIQIDTKSVQTTLRVSNAKGKATSVEKSDLRLLVDGKEQEIAYFATNQVKKFTVLLDASSSMRGNRYKRAICFLNELADNSLPGQSFDIIVFAEKTQFIGTLTKKDKKAVFDKLKKLNPYGETALYDSVVETLRKFDVQAEASALIVITDGTDTMSSEDTKNEANSLLSQFGTMTYLIVLDTKMAYRSPGTAPNDDIAKLAVKDFETILQPVAFIIKNEIQFSELAERIPLEAGFLVRIGFDPDDLTLLSDKEIHKLEIVHADARLQLTYRQAFSVKGVK
jgi:Mg-chelatase subunit ChlD